MRKLFWRRCLLGTYVGRGEKAGVIGYNGHFRAVITCLIENPLLELYKIIQMLFKSGIQVPNMVLRLQSRAIDPRGNLPPFLLEMTGLSSTNATQEED